jgi:hypothetical protein
LHLLEKLKQVLRRLGFSANTDLSGLRFAAKIPAYSVVSFDADGMPKGQDASC